VRVNAETALAALHRPPAAHLLHRRRPETLRTVESRHDAKAIIPGVFGSRNGVAPSSRDFLLELHGAVARL